MTARSALKWPLRTAAAFAALVGLIGCAASPQFTRVHVPVPVECKEAEPQRPPMPTEALAPGVTPWLLLRAALAEIDRREGYEVQLRTALRICTTPLENQ